MTGTRWVRNRQGSVVHRAECPRIKGRGIRWEYPEAKGVTDGRALYRLLHDACALDKGWNEACSVCDPYDGQDK